MLNMNGGWVLRSRQCHDSTRDNDDDIIHWGKADEPP